MPSSFLIRRGFAAAILIVGSLGVLRASGSVGDSGGWGFSETNLDRTCKPCDDFNQFAMGGWMKNNPIPAEYPNWGSFTMLADRNQASMRVILEEAGKANAAAGSNQQKIGDFYASCMDTSAIDAAGVKPLAADFAAIDAVKDASALQPLIGRLQQTGAGYLFRFDSTQDLDESTQVIAEINQSGLGLPDRDYYTRTDEKSAQLRTDYAAHVAKMFVLAGDSGERANADAKTVMELETALAKASMSRVQMRDPHAVWHKMTLPQLRELAPGWGWEAYFRQRNAPEFSSINVSQPDFFKETNRLLTATPLKDWKTYLRWHVLHASATQLSEPFVQENFNFYGTKLSGTKQLQPRWKRCSQSVNRNLGEALGEVYVEKYFPPEAKAHARLMVMNLIGALKSDIPELGWMGPETKKAALEKLEAFQIKIGYPDKWRDYSALPVDKGSYLANERRAIAFENARDLNKIGKPVDRGEWQMTPPTVNAYYDSTMNEIVFPAGILQPPFYDPQADDAVNYGGMGAAIGHEITHGFDDQGSQFDAKGNLRDWWTKQDRKNFDERATCVQKQFDGYEVEPGLHENGKLVLGESIADLGGLAISYAAYEKSIEGKRPATLGGFTPEQRFFLGWAQVWGANMRAENARLMANTNEHPLPKFRTNGPLSNMELFAKAFACKKGDAMVRESVCKIW
ncbi:MAG TPA: M13 family metallopeptidase [Candidatus Eisenbacteria bacterium]|nr:M13 family metallopeptidase [Candidatus Eisenbacteria bacterium]